MPMFARLLGTDRAEKHPSLPSTFGIESRIDGHGKKLILPLYQTSSANGAVRKDQSPHNEFHLVIRGSSVGRGIGVYAA